MKIHLLDMGQTKYGDCLLIEQSGRKILIDGGHPGDTSSIRTQLKKILKQDAPFKFDLLVVTHCHSDHIGCLPDLVLLDIVRPKKALIADENLGFGRARNGERDADVIPLNNNQRDLVAALVEEDHSDLQDQELMQFMDDAGNLEKNYLAMITKMESASIPIIRYGTDIADEGANHELLSSLENEFKDFGFKILGPTQNHLVICAEAINSTMDFLSGDIVRSSLTDEIDTLNAYRSLCQVPIGEDFLGAEDKAGTGSAKNNQSLVFKVSEEGFSALLGGDMQFAKAEVKGLNESMSKLLDKVVANGPYEFIKLTHHTSYNAYDKRVSDLFKGTKLLAHTGGRNDKGHPEKIALKLLENLQSEISFARNDRNGIITVQGGGGLPTFTLSRGVLNDFTPNFLKDEILSPVIPTPSQQAKPIVIEKTMPVIPSNEPFVEISAKIPHQSTKVTITIDVQPGGITIGRDAPEFKHQGSGGTIAPGRTLPRLLMATSSAALQLNIGKAGTRQFLQALHDYPEITLVDLPAGLPAQEASELVQTELKKSSYDGVVIIGGFDVIPSEKFNVLDAKLREELKLNNFSGADADDFIVWSDDLYGDLDGDRLPELPVSRIPDGHNSELLFAALGAPSFNGGQNLASEILPGHLPTIHIPLFLAARPQSSTFQKNIHQHTFPAERHVERFIICSMALTKTAVNFGEKH